MSNANNNKISRKNKLKALKIHPTTPKKYINNNILDDLYGKINL